MVRNETFENCNRSKEFYLYLIEDTNTDGTQYFYDAI